MITRELLQNGWLKCLAALAPDPTQIRTEAELTDCLRRTLAGRDMSEDLWVFAYGSLVWNPAFHYTERRRGRVFGYHRRFCLWTQLGRGTPENPGLMLGLDHGGSCHGCFYRIAAPAIRDELTLVWRREMITNAYVPTWLKGRIDNQPVRALGFVINHDHPRYAGRLDLAATVAAIASAQGPLGCCADYLFSTHAHLVELAIHDPQLALLCRLVSEHRAATTSEPVLECAKASEVCGIPSA